MAKDIIKSFDEEVEKNQELQSTTETVEDVVKSDTVEDTETVEKSDTVEKSTEDKEDTEKSEDTKDEDKEDAEKSTDEDAEKSEDKDEDKENAEKSDDEDKEDKEDVEKSDVDFEALLNVVIKSYTQLASQVSAIQGELTAVKSSQIEISKSLDDMKVTPAQIAEGIAKSIDGITETVETEVEGKAVGYLEKSSIIDDELEEVEKSANNVETAPVSEVSFAQVEELFKSKFTEATEKSANARDENNLREITKSWQRYINDRATSADTDRINSFINS